MRSEEVCATAHVKRNHERNDVCAVYCAADGISTSTQRTLLKRTRMNGGVAQRLKADQQTLLNKISVVMIAFMRRSML